MRLPSDPSSDATSGQGLVHRRGRDLKGKQDTQNEVHKDISEIQRRVSRRPPPAIRLFCPPNTRRPMVNVLHPQPQLPPAPAPPPPPVLVPLAVHNLLQQPGGLRGALFKSKHISTYYFGYSLTARLDRTAQASTAARGPP